MIWGENPLFLETPILIYRSVQPGKLVSTRKRPFPTIPRWDMLISLEKNHFKIRGDQDALHELKDLRSQADELRRELKMLANAAFEAEEIYGEIGMVRNILKEI